MGRKYVGYNHSVWESLMTVKVSSNNLQNNIEIVSKSKLTNFENDFEILDAELMCKQQFSSFKTIL